ncbi:TPA: AlpA family phage regulatory protein [Escherichia coli]
MSTQTGHFYTPSRILRMAELTRPVRLGSSAVGWRASAIDEWLTLHTTPTRSVTKDK